VVINNWPNKEDFIYKECKIGETNCVLISPQYVGVKWNADNLIFRSSIWTIHGEPVSLGFKKFFNYGEAPHLVPDPKNLDGVAIEKVDGSLLIVSKFRGQLIIRTRGTIDAKMLDNGNEIGYLKSVYPRAFSNGWIDSEIFSFLYEWTTPDNRIILDYGNAPNIRLVGVVYHLDYSYWDQSRLDAIAEHLGVKRPKTFEFNSLPEMISSVKALKNQEGICFYFDGGQEIKKLKSLDYLAKHSFKESINKNSVIEMFVYLGRPSKESFFSVLERQFDYEIATFALPLLNNLYKAYDRITNFNIENVKFITRLQKISRFDAAFFIRQEYKSGLEQNLAFLMLDNQIPSDIFIRQFLDENM